MGQPLSRENWQGARGAARLRPVRTVRCPTCRRQVVWEDNRHRPFCSDRCRLLDLAAWADERFRIPGEPVSEEASLPDEDDVP